MPGIGPGVGMGTMEHVDGSRSAEAMYDATAAFLRQGGRHLDCAELYSTGGHVARAIADCGLERGELHVTTKLAGLPIDRGDGGGPREYAAVRQRLVRHLEELGLTHVDLLLIHWPGPPAPPGCAPTDGFAPAHARMLLDGEPADLAAACSWAHFDEHIDAAWDNMQRLREDGLCTEIGVSNMSLAHLDRLIAAGPTVAPFANQVHISVTHQQTQLVTEMLARGILPIAYRALAYLPVVEMAAGMGDGTHATLCQLKEALAADSVQQVVLAWLVRRGCHVLAKSADEARVLQNIQACQLARSPRWPDNVDALLAGAEGSEMVEMCGGVDCCAQTFMAIAPAPAPAPAAAGQAPNEQRPEAQ